MKGELDEGAPQQGGVAKAKHMGRIAAFVCRVSGKSRPEALRCVRFSIFHQTDQGDEPCTTEVLSEDEPEKKVSAQKALERLNSKRIETLAGNIAEVFYDEAESRTEGVSRPQAFLVRGYTSMDLADDPIETMTFKLIPDHMPAEAMGLEGPDALGQQNQVSRTLEVVVRELTRATANAQLAQSDVHKQAMQQMQMMTERAMVLEKNQLAMTMMIQDMADKKQEREVTLWLEKIKVEREERWMKMAEDAVQKLTPFLADRFLAGPATKVFKKLLEDKERFKMVYMAMTEDEKTVVKEAMDQYLGLNMLGEGAAKEPIDARVVSGHMNGGGKPS